MSLRSRARVAQRPDRVVVVEAVENLGDILGHVHAAEPLPGLDFRRDIGQVRAVYARQLAVGVERVELFPARP